MARKINFLQTVENNSSVSQSPILDRKDKDKHHIKVKTRKHTVLILW